MSVGQIGIVEDTPRIPVSTCKWVRLAGFEMWKHEECGHTVCENGISLYCEKCGEPMYDNLPRSNAVGEWISRENHTVFNRGYNCSICDGYSTVNTAHCKNCGAKMKNHR